MTDEARVLKDLRLKHNLSLVDVARRVGVTNSYVCQIEKGRTDPPQGTTLLKFLKVFGDIGVKYFDELVREKKKEVTDLQVINDLLPRLKPAQLKMVRVLIGQTLKEH